MNGTQIRRALLSVSDKEGIVELGRALAEAGAELVATGRTAGVLQEAGLTVVPIEKVSGSPEAFQGRMKTLSFPVCSGILYRRGDASDARDLATLKIQPIDCVVVNFYPFEKAAEKPGIERAALIEEVDIGGPTLVRAAAKNAPDVLVLTSPAQYGEVIRELRSPARAVSAGTAHRCAAEAWDRVLAYDSAIAARLGSGAAAATATSAALATAATASAAGAANSSVRTGFGADGGARERKLRYGENPHQTGRLEIDANSPIDWETPLTPTELSYNNILDLTAAYGLASDLAKLAPDATGVVIVKHNNPCGVATVPRANGAQLTALQKAWDGDPVSAFGGVLVFTDALEPATAAWLAERFVELVAAPGLRADDATLRSMTLKRKNLKAVAIRRLGEMPRETAVVVPGGRLYQTADVNLGETLRSVTRVAFARDRERLGAFGIAVCRALKSNAIALVRDLPDVPGGLQLVGAGQGQPNRIEALQALAVPRARTALSAHGGHGSLGDCVMVSDAFFPFRDTVDAAHAAGIRAIIQPGGSIKDADSIAACDEHGIAMAFTGHRHFRH